MGMMGKRTFRRARLSWGFLVTISMVSGAAWWVVQLPNLEEPKSEERHQASAPKAQTAVALPILSSEQVEKSSVLHEALDLRGMEASKEVLIRPSREEVEESEEDMGKAVRQDDWQGEVFRKLVLTDLSDQVVDSLLAFGKASLVIRTSLGDYVGIRGGRGSVGAMTFHPIQHSPMALSQLQIDNPDILSAYPKTLLEFHLQQDLALGLSVKAVKLVFTEQTAQEMYQSRQQRIVRGKELGCFDDQLRFRLGGACHGGQRQLASN